MTLYAFELPNDYKKPRRIVGVICDDIFFRVEENPKEDRNWDNGAYSIFHIDVRNPYNMKNHWSSRKRVAEADSVIKAKKIILSRIQNIKDSKKSSMEDHNEQKSTSYPVAALPAGDNSDFFPTPLRLAGKMLALVNWKTVKLILEPSAGKGDLVMAVERMVADRKYSDKFVLTNAVQEHTRECFDTIESDYNLRLILRGLGLRLIDDDFLRFQTAKRYDLILMNPPFSEGAKHLIHAIDIMSNGGQIVCILNAETVRNPYSNERKLLQNLLIENNARIEFVRDIFKRAERRTNTEVAIIYINIPAQRGESKLFEKARKAAEIDIEAQRVGRDNQIVVSDEVEQMIAFFNAEAKAGIELLTTYDELTPYILEGEEKYDKPIIRICVGDHHYNSASNEVVNDFLKALRYKYWKALLNRPSLTRKMTHAIKSEYSSKVREMAEYDFNRHNIAQVLFDIQAQLTQGVEDAILNLFERLSSKHCCENEKNIHYYTGWKTNKAHAVGMKAILPIDGFAASYSWLKGQLDEYRICEVISDLEKSLHYLDKGEVGISYDVTGAIRTANANNRTTAYFSYFSVRFFKKGTAHFTFYPEVKPIIDRLNIFAGRNKGWLPPCYGRKRYEDMEAEEKAVIDEFQGAEAYNQVMSNPGNYIIDQNSLQPMLSA